VTERKRLAHREVKNPLGTRRERDLPGCRLIALTDDASDLGAYLLDGKAKRLERACRKTFLFSEETEKHMLSADVVVPKRACFVLRENDYLTRTPSKALEHAASLARPGGGD
jgi:hypothetical protein